MTGTIEGAMPRTTNNAERIKPNWAQLDKETVRYVFFAGDVIDPTTKYAMPSRAFGGIHLGHKTLRHSHGMIYRCCITPLLPKMKAIGRRMVDPVQLSKWESSYVLENGKVGPNGLEDLEVNVSTLVHKKVLPGDEIQDILKASQPLGEGGIVEITALLGASIQERDEVQFFFFPKWFAIQENSSLLPSTSEFEAYIRERMALIERSVDSENQAKYRSIGQAMLRSHIEYCNWGKKYNKTIEKKIKSAEAKGNEYEYPVKAEIVLEQLGMGRKDNLTTDSNAATRELVLETREERRENREREERRAREEREDRLLAIEERKLAIEEAKLKIGQSESSGYADTLPSDYVPPTSTMTVSASTNEPISVTAAEIPVIYTIEDEKEAARECGQPTVTGGLCTRILKEHETVCYQHSVKSEE